MSAQQRSTSSISAEEHMQAAECCNKAAVEHHSAARYHASGDHKKAGEHARNAHDQCAKALEHSKKAMQPEGRSQAA